jgi:hypothetical protein
MHVFVKGILFFVQTNLSERKKKRSQLKTDFLFVDQTILGDENKIKDKCPLAYSAAAYSVFYFRYSIVFAGVAFELFPVLPVAHVQQVADRSSCNSVFLFL